MSSDLRYAYTSVTRRWSRNLRSILAVAISATTVVILVCVAHSSSLSVSDRLAGLDSRTVTALLPSDAWSQGEDSLTRVLQSDPNILSAGIFVAPDGSAPVDVRSPLQDISVSAGVVVATSAGLLARGATIVEGSKLPDSELVLRENLMVLLGQRLAKELRVSLDSGPVTIELRGVTVAVVGIVRDNADESALSTAVVIDPTTAAALGLLPETCVLLVAVGDGNPTTVAEYLPTALYPKDPSAVSVQFGTSPAALTAALVADSQNLINLISGVLVAVTAFSILTTMNVSVMERRREIGVNRAMGQTRLDIARQFLFESTFVGVTGSAAGFIFGTIVVAATSQAIGWTFVLPPVLLALPLFGGAVGAVAGFWPALQAARVDPSELLRA